ncbi:MAG: phosphoribosylformylglycinamidine synthase subunit PurL [Candidatus Peribacteraceae bacterium]|nr:phosphoribosylformylglycinamidine synthase subunit PurL [Candidatus Peribacteraceae bacterium]
MTPSPTLPFATMTDDEVKAALSKHRIGLTVEEARKVQEMLGRPPTLTEATIWGIQGSEHCSYKSSRRFLKQFLTDSSHVILGPKEDSGIVAITDGPKGKRWGIVISHESHNKPSQLVPYEGSATGVGGCVRDVVCMGARVIGALDNLRLGDLQTQETRSIASEVTRGIAGYGNPLGIPNLGGDTIFDAAYNKQCLVNVVVVGLMREDEIIHSYAQQEAGKAGYDIIIVGKATDRSGFGGASFASVTIKEEDSERNTGAVQEPNPFLERHLLASSYALFDKLVRDGHLDKVSFKDLGAGGVVCASVEQVAPVGMGAIVDLDKLHKAIADLPAEVAACAETQERFCWICHPSLTADILHHYNVTWDLPSVAEGAAATVVGKVTEDDTYTLLSNGEKVCSARSEDITSGLQYVRPTKDPQKTFTEPTITYTDGSVGVAGKKLSIEEIFMGMIGHPSHASKADIFKHYDKNIIGNGVIEAGEADATVIQPLRDIARYSSEEGHSSWELTEAEAKVGVALASGGNGRYGRISPYLQGVNAVTENISNIAAVGATPRALSDCLNYGNPEIPEQLWALEQGVKGIADAAKAIALDGEGVPVISGNVSLYNGGIDPNGVVCCVGVMPDAQKAITMQIKKVGSQIFLLGKRKDECGGSAYYDVLERLTKSVPDSLLGKNVPTPDFAVLSSQLRFMREAIGASLLLSAHDISEGGLLLALYEMTLPQRKCGGDIGLQIDMASIVGSLRIDTALFSETGGFVLEVAPDQVSAISKLAADHGCELLPLGKTVAEPVIKIASGSSQILDLSFAKVRPVWENALLTALNG